MALAFIALVAACSGPAGPGTPARGRSAGAAPARTGSPPPRAAPLPPLSFAFPTPPVWHRLDETPPDRLPRLALQVGELKIPKATSGALSAPIPAEAARALEARIRSALARQRWMAATALEAPAGSPGRSGDLTADAALELSLQREPHPRILVLRAYLVCRVVVQHRGTGYLLRVRNSFDGRFGRRFGSLLEADSPPRVEDLPRLAALPEFHQLLGKLVDTALAANLEQIRRDYPLYLEHLEKRGARIVFDDARARCTLPVREIQRRLAQLRRARQKDLIDEPLYRTKVQRLEAELRACRRRRP